MAAISKLAGMKHIRIAGRPTFFKSLISSASPALVRITIRAICLKSAEIFNSSGAIKFSAYGPNTIPVSSIPTRPGSFSFCMVPLNIMPQRTIIARLKSILILLCAEMQKSRHFCNEIIAEVISLISGSAKISTGRTSFPWAIIAKMFENFKE